MTDTFDLTQARQLANNYRTTPGVVGEISSALAAACDEVERVRAERDALRQALAVYADRHNWFARPGEEYAISFSAKDDSWLTDHGGDLAATALRQARGEERS